jgi:hypothetical protein
MQATLQVVSRGALSNFIHPTYTPTPLFPVRIFLPEEMWQSGPLDRYDPTLYLVCLSKEVNGRHVRAARMCDHETPRVNSINPNFSAQQRRKRSLMRTQALVLVLIVIAASEPARLFRAIVNGVVALLQCVKLL